MKTRTLRDVFVHELKDLYSAETQLTRALPRMSEAADSDELSKAFREHLKKTEEHVRRLETILGQCGESTRGSTCRGMAGLIAEGEEIIDEHGAEPATDALLLTLAQKVEHYEIAGYGSARTYARMLGETEAVELLEKTLSEEKDTDAELTHLAETSVNTGIQQWSA